MMARGGIRCAIPPYKLGVVTGLRAEAGCLGRSASGEGVRIRCTGARAGAAAPAAAALIAEGCRGLVSFGTAGALEPRLRPGTLVVPAAVIMADGARIAVDAGWHQRLCARLGGRVALVTDAIAAVDAPLLTPAAKAACHRATGAVAVDMESGAVARATAQPSPSRWRGSLPLPAGEGEGEGPSTEAAAAALPLPAGEGEGEGARVPFIVVRAIADPAERTVPAWVMQAVTADGRTLIAPVLSHLARHPGELPALIHLARDARAAMRSLRRVAALAGPFFAFHR